MCRCNNKNSLNLNNDLQKLNSKLSHLAILDSLERLENKLDNIQESLDFLLIDELEDDLDCGCEECEFDDEEDNYDCLECENEDLCFQNSCDDECSSSCECGCQD